MSEGEIGPLLPPHMRTNKKPSSESSGPSLPMSRLQHGRVTGLSESVGPALPPHLLNKRMDSAEIDLSVPSHMTQSAANASTDDIGPSLPPHMNISDNSSANIGPSLPPHMRTHTSDSDDVGPSLPPHMRTHTSDSDDVGPSLPPHMRTHTSDSDVIGPSLPPHMRSHTSDSDDVGPSLPPHMRTHTSDSDVVGPSLPPHMRTHTLDSDDVGPSLPPHMQGVKAGSPSMLSGRSGTTRRENREHVYHDDDGDDEEDNDVIGPPAFMAANQTSAGEKAEFAAAEFELRYEWKRELAERKKQASVIPGEKAREEWMMELPAVGTAGSELGLTARSFRAKAAPEQSSDWTAVPGKEKKKAEKKKVSSNVTERDLKIQATLDAYNEEHRKDSLMEMHSKKRKKEKTEAAAAAASAGPEERKPFNREDDLKVNRFDDAQVKVMVKKSQNFNSRFSHGSQKFE